MVQISYDEVLKPGYYEEKPKHRSEGQARPHHDDTTGSAVELALWLAENGIQALVSPKTPTTAAVVHVTLEFGEPLLVWPSDWVLLEDRGENGVYPRVLKQSEIAFNYRRQGD